MGYCRRSIIECTVYRPGNVMFCVCHSTTHISRQVMNIFWNCYKTILMILAPWFSEISCEMAHNCIDKNWTALIIEASQLDSFIMQKTLSQKQTISFLCCGKVAWTKTYKIINKETTHALLWKQNCCFHFNVNAAVTHFFWQWIWRIQLPGSQY